MRVTARNNNSKCLNILYCWDNHDDDHDVKEGEKEQKDDDNDDVDGHDGRDDDDDDDNGKVEIEENLATEGEI